MLAFFSNSFCKNLSKAAYKNPIKAAALIFALPLIKKHY